MGVGKIPGSIKYLLHMSGNLNPIPITGIKYAKCGGSCLMTEPGRCRQMIAGTHQSTCLGCLSELQINERPCFDKESGQYPKNNISNFHIHTCTTHTQGAESREKGRREGKTERVIETSHGWQQIPVSQVLDRLKQVGHRFEFTQTNTLPQNKILK